jgi:hypothetical protein
MMEFEENPRLGRIVCMEAKDVLAGRLARLPDLQLVRIEIVHEDGYATDDSINQ